MGKHLYRWNWNEGGYNQCYADTKAQARKLGNAIVPGKLTIDEKTFRRVKNADRFWKNYPIFD
jgi:hypothetical protein